MNETSLNKVIFKAKQYINKSFCKLDEFVYITPMDRTCFILQRFMSSHVCMNLPQFPLKIEVNTLSGIICKYNLMNLYTLIFLKVLIISILSLPV